MQEFHCDSPACASHLTASTKDELMRQVEQHVKDVHNVDNPTQTILSYLASTVRDEAGFSAR
ncbi:MAG: DUF1059 domain-containing protein [Pseudonocardiaceae bacterium]|nr:DUF1059 domain-containing protein [Pseudonocardiaceae bacterium]